jgi:hypothetical protein
MGINQLRHDDIDFPRHGPNLSSMGTRKQYSSHTPSKRAHPRVFLAARFQIIEGRVIFFRISFVK